MGGQPRHYDAYLVGFPEATERGLRTQTRGRKLLLIEELSAWRGIRILELAEKAIVRMREANVTQGAITISPGARFKAAMTLAILADALQIAVFPLFVEGAASPVDDMLDLGMGAALFYLLGWHWEFLPSFLGKLVPGVDLAPFWTIAVANVYRKSKDTIITLEGNREAPPSPPDRN